MQRCNKIRFQIFLIIILSTRIKYSTWNDQSFISSWNRLQKICFEDLEKILLDADINKWFLDFFCSSLLILLTTFSYNDEISINKFNIKDIKIENNNFLKKDLLKIFILIWKKFVFLNDSDIEKK